MDNNAFSGKLLGGERILWLGRPGQGLMLGKGDAFMIPFSLMWGGGAVASEINLTASGAPLLTRLWGIPFVLIGFYFVIGRFYHDAYMRRHLHYAVTARRILILRDKPSTSFMAVSLDRLPEITLSERRNGRGTIFFGQSVANSKSGTSIPDFIAIEDVQSVFALIQRALHPA